MSCAGKSWLQAHIEKRIMKNSTIRERRAVITGVGAVTCSGIGRQEFWDSLLENRSGIDYIQSFDVSDLPVKFGGEVRGFNPTDYMRRRDVQHSGRFSQFALAVARMAVEDSGLKLDAIDPYDVGVVFGSSGSGVGSVADRNYHNFVTKGDNYVDPRSVVEIPAHATTSHICIALGVKGPNSSFSAGCATGIESVAQAARLVRAKHAKVVIAGASETCLSRVVFAQLCRQGVLSKHNDNPKRACRPFDISRDGLVLAEGAGAVIVEDAEYAMSRGATILAEYGGYGSATEARHMVFADPSGEELAVAFREALRLARLSPADVDYCCAHGIGNHDYDIADTRALKKVLGERAYSIPVTSIKPVTGQPFAAGGTLSVIASSLALHQQIVPATLNHRVPDPECDLDYVPDGPLQSRVNCVLLNAHSFGGTHAALALKSFVE